MLSASVLVMKERGNVSTYSVVPEDSNKKVVVGKCAERAGS